MPRKFLSILRALFRKTTIERELDRELQYHLERHIESNLRKGLSPREARQLALKDFGGLEKVKEECRETRPGTLLEQAWQDLRYGARVLRSSPGFTIVAVLCLALGIGATTAMFSVVSAVLLRPLPYSDPDRLMMIFAATRQENRGTFAISVTGPDFGQWMERNQSFEEMGAFWGPGTSSLTGIGEPLRVRSAQVTAGLFRALGVSPARGRSFSDTDQGAEIAGITVGATPGAARYALVSDRFWRNTLGTDPEVIGKSIRLNDESFSIIGVMPAGFNFPDGVDLWTPVPISATRGNAYLRVVGRLRSGTRLEQAQADMDVIANQIALELPQSNSPVGRPKVVPLREQLVGKVRPTLLVFLGAVGFVLLIACANVANLQIARGALRQREIAVRSALGAGKGRIARQLLTENLLLSLVGGALGLLVAYIALALILSTAPANIPRINDIRIDGRVLGFTLVLSVLTGLVFGIAPALQASNSDLTERLKEAARSTQGPARQRLRTGLVVAETALAMVLLIGAGLLSETFLRLAGMDLGFQHDKVLTMAVDLPPSVYRTPLQARDYIDRAIHRIGTVAGVRSAAATNAVPLGNGLHIRGDFTVEGEIDQPRLSPAKLVISPDYFQALRIPLRQGRFFDDRDTDQASGVVIVSESLARAIASNAEAIGKRIDVGFTGESPRQIIGVVGDTRQDALTGNSLAIYQPYDQVSRVWQMAPLNFMVQTSGDPEMLISDVRSVLQEVDKDLPIYDVKPLGRVVSEKVSDPRFYASLLGAFSLIAMALAAAGIYGLTSYSVARRTHEIGIRVALGARRTNILGMMLLKGMISSLSGLILGLAGAALLTRLLTDFLYGVTPTDPGTFAGISFLLAAAASLASYIPARRALAVDPMIALRQE